MISNASRFGPAPSVRIAHDGSVRCFDLGCETPFGRRTNAGIIVFLPGWVYQGEIWRSRSLQDEMRGDRHVDADGMWEMTDRMPRKRNQPDPRLIFASSTLPTHVQCPSCRYVQRADPDVVGATEATTSLIERRRLMPRWLDRSVSRVAVRRGRRPRRTPWGRRSPG